MQWVADAIGASGGWITDGTSIYNGNIDNTDAFVGIGTKTPTSTLDVNGVCTMDQESGFSGKNKINIIPIPNPLVTDFSGNTSNINMWGTFTNDGGYHDNSPRQTATIQSGFSNQLNSKYSPVELSNHYKGAWGGEYLSFKVGNYESSSKMTNSSSMHSSTFSDISGVDLNNEVMRITAEGNVGIGTTAPTSTLDVSGTLQVSGYTVLNQGINIGSSPYKNSSSANSVLQGTSIQWNRVVGLGITYIMNNKGEGSGGISFGTF
jgi:hypothetical protein